LTSVMSPGGMVSGTPRTTSTYLSKYLKIRGKYLAISN